MQELIFRVNGIPLPQPKLKNFGRSWKAVAQDDPIRFRDPGTGRLVTRDDDLDAILMKHDIAPALKYDQKSGGKYLLQLHPRRYWVYLIQSAALAAIGKLPAEGREWVLYPKNLPLIVGCVFYLPKPKRNKVPFPMVGDLDNYRYPIWNALKGGVVYHDDNQIVWEREGGKLWANADNPPGVVVWIGTVTPDRMERIDDIANLYNVKLRQGGKK